MKKADWAAELRAVSLAGAEIGEGLSDSEIADIESYWEFRFPPDLREFLQTTLPVSPSFPAWRSFRSDEMAGRFAWPSDGICYDIEYNEFWNPAWGKRPAELREAIELARDQLRSVPRLIPVYSHRYLPAAPEEAGNPVFSVYGTDIIYYGSDLRTYLMTEFGDLTWEEAVQNVSKRIPFWTDLVELD